MPKPIQIEPVYFYPIIFNGSRCGLLGAILWLAPLLLLLASDSPAQTGAEDRAFTVQTLTNIAGPVLTALADGKLKQEIPKHDWERNREQCAPLEAFGRTLAGIASWLELGPDDPATIEAALWQFTGECNLQPIEYAVQKHEQWYLGDGTYGDATEFHWDYYNSYVIQPMLLAVLKVCADKKNPLGDLYPKTLARAQRYAVVQERMISPEGTFPVIGHSSAYRFGAQGWLQVGAVGHQPSIREDYISTDSLYLCLCGTLQLGLPADDPFWTAPPEPWTQKKIWSGEDVPPDHACEDKR
jgi:Uncharacterized protein conserved in bacteria (DUF2264)